MLAVVDSKQLTSEFFTGLFISVGVGALALWGIGLIIRKVVQVWTLDTMKSDTGRNVFIQYAKEIARAEVTAHDDAVNSHGTYRRQAEATWRAELGTVLVEHEKDRTAHHGYALEPYATRQDLMHAVDTMKLTLGAFKDSVVAMQAGLKDQLNEQKDQLARIEALMLDSKGGSR